jgi:hypothetical protein
VWALVLLAAVSLVPAVNLMELLQCHMLPHLPGHLWLHLLLLLLLDLPRGLPAGWHLPLQTQLQPSLLPLVLSRGTAPGPAQHTGPIWLPAAAHTAPVGRAAVLAGN